MKKIIFFLSVVVLASLVTISLNAFDNSLLRKQDKRVVLNLSIQETELVMKALGKLPLEESGGLYFNIQQQAQSQLAPPQKPKPDSSTVKPVPNKPKNP